MEQNLQTILEQARTIAQTGNFTKCVYETNNLLEGIDFLQINNSLSQEITNIEITAKLREVYGWFNQLKTIKNKRDSPLIKLYHRSARNGINADKKQLFEQEVQNILTKNLIEITLNTYERVMPQIKDQNTIEDMYDEASDVVGETTIKSKLHVLKKSDYLTRIDSIFKN